MTDKIDNRGTHMTVRPMTPAEMARWPDGEIAFTIHYEGGDIKAHALTRIEDAEEFADTVKQACQDVRKQRELKENMRNHIMFVRCGCGKLHSLNVFLFNCDEEQRGPYICPDCGQDIEETCDDPVPFDEGWEQDAKRLLPAFVKRHGEGIHSYYTGKDGKRLVPPE